MATAKPAKGAAGAKLRKPASPSAPKRGRANQDFPIIAVETETRPRPGRRDGPTAGYYRQDAVERIESIRHGVPASMIAQLSGRMGMSKENLLSSLGLSRATIGRKERDQSVLSKDESERVLGVEALIGLVQKMVDESGNPDGFDAARWVADWLSKPLPALGGATPASYMDTFEGQRMVAELLAMSQSGAYA